MTPLSIAGLMRYHSSNGVASTACYSHCQRYRYILARRWSDGPTICFLMLNPSTATELANDPTVERCERRARAWGYGKLIVANLFAYRATDPRELRRVGDPIGPDNDQAIIEAAADSAIVVCAWGNHGAYLNRSTVVRALLAAESPGKTRALRVGKTGEPGHPLYLPYELEPVVWPEDGTP